ncbi:MAG: T9SS type A sorting domain-containing protein [Bacteroidales bacterium]|jgi:hypothetical protein|nr:T9SS type A sorting domain-containing protein [Bacteroidales bacterium]
MKKLVFILGLIFLTATYSNAQSSYEVYDTVGGNMVLVPNGGVLHRSLKNTDNDFSFPLWVKNVSAVPCTTWAKKVYINILQGTQNWFCWEGCYFPNTMVSSKPYIIGPSQLYGGFDSHYKAAGKTGESRIRYVFFNGQNTSDTTYFEVVFTTTPTGIDDKTTTSGLTISPNPASSMVKISYNLLTGINGTLVFRNILGQVIKTFLLTDPSGTVSCDLSEFSEGIYFVTLSSDKEHQILSKLIISH